MNPGLVVKLRPVGPWRIGPDSGARNRVDTIFHSDTLFSAVTSAMARLGLLTEWLDATAHSRAPAVSFSSSFPFVDEIGFVVPPRTIWPPTSPALMGARVRWKSARFVPLGIVQALLAGQTLEESHWAIDGPSECLVPVGRTGPFRTGVRWNAAVDRLTGSTERHSTACIEFRAGSGLWTIVAFADEAARDRWIDPVKAAFRLLADSGLGGERSRGWGRSDAPEFIEGTLPEMILGAPEVAPEAQPEPEPVVIAAVGETEPAPVAVEPSPESEQVAVEPTSEPEPVEMEPAPGPETVAVEPSPEPVAEPEPEPEPFTTAEPAAALPSRDREGADEPVSDAAPAPEPEPAPLESASVTAPPEAAPLVAPAPEPPAAPQPSAAHAHWMLSLFTPAASDSVDWARGNYTLLTRAGRVESPAGSGELKKTVQMVAEGSVIYVVAAPHGAAADVAPDGFAHPVFRAGFAVAIPLPEVSA